MMRILFSEKRFNGSPGSDVLEFVEVFDKLLGETVKLGAILPNRMSLRLRSVGSLCDDAETEPLHSLRFGPRANANNLVNILIENVFQQLIQRMVRVTHTNDRAHFSPCLVLEQNTKDQLPGVTLSCAWRALYERDTPRQSV